MNNQPSKFAATLYFLLVRILYYFSGLVWLQQCQKKYITTIEAFFQEINYPVISRRDIVMYRFVDKLWGKRLMSMASIIVKGKEHLDAAQLTGKGIVLARFHHGLSRSLHSWLNQQRFKPVMSIGERRRIIEDKQTDILSNTQDLLDAFRILQKGGVVEIAADGHRGLQAIQIPFFQRLRSFRTSFAELALSTQAQIIPIHLQFQTNGIIVIEIFPCLQPPCNASYEQQVVSTVEQYVEILSAFWKANPAMLTVKHIKKHIALPKLP